MKIVVLVKQVPDVSQMSFDSETRTLRREGVRLEVSSFDVRALLRAVDLAKEIGGAEVVAMTMGPPQAREALVHCLALGADRAVHLVDRALAGSDTLATARALAAALRREGFDLVLAGKTSVDAETGQVGPETAELLDVPQVTAARTLTIDVRRRQLRAERETDDGFETVETPLPALVTAAEDLAEERFPKKADREAAASKPIVQVAASDLSTDASLFGFAGSPTRVEEIRELPESRERKVLQGDLDAVVGELAELLAGRGALALGSRAARPVPPRERRADPARAVWVLAETLGDGLRRVSLELLGGAVGLSGQSGSEVVAVLLGHGVTARAEALVQHGADRVLVADDPVLVDYSTEGYAAVLAEAIRSRRPRHVIAPSTYYGRDLMPRVAARLGLGLTGDCIDLTLDRYGRLVQWKPAFGGAFVAPILSSTLPEMATVRPGMLQAFDATPDREGVVERLPVREMPPIRTRVVDRRTDPEALGAARLDDAAVVVGVGKGVGGPEHLRGIDAFSSMLARFYGDVPIATTRDVTEAGWLPKQLQVGLTGRAIAPRLYFAVGIRGAFEHVVGLRRAGTIVAINKNPKAPIFQHADFGIVADWTAALPALGRALEERLGAPGV
jgi:electron transfer flavoprotein alpha subunit